VRDGVVLVLDRPRDVTNGGGVGHTMGNFGLTRRRLVEPAAYAAGIHVYSGCDDTWQKGTCDE
jgi:tRNA C32,U32 (ribose-2'-O)-methylase TrmJ